MVKEITNSNFEKRAATEVQRVPQVKRDSRQQA